MTLLSFYTAIDSQSPLFWCFLFFLKWNFGAKKGTKKCCKKALIFLWSWQPKHHFDSQWKTPKTCSKPQKWGFFGANDENRTRDLILTMDVLCLLSYISVFYYFLYFLIICKNCSDNLTKDKVFKNQWTALIIKFHFKPQFYLVFTIFHIIFIYQKILAVTILYNHDSHWQPIKLEH